MKKNITMTLLCLAAASLISACGAKSSGTVATDGSTSMEKVIGALGEAFQNDTGIGFTYNPTGSGSSMRYSATLTEQTVYEAVRLSDKTVLRISVSRATALLLLLGMLQPIIFILIAAVLLSALLAQKMARRVVDPLNNLNLEAPMENDAYEELSPLLLRIRSQQAEINRQLLELEQKQEEFKLIIENMQEALILLDFSGRILSINPAAARLFNTDISCIGQDMLSIDRSYSMRTGLEAANLEGHADFRAKRNERDYQFDLSRIPSGEGRHGTVILAFDITEQLNAERHRQEFTANVSHELKTPLQSIIGSAELIENGIVKDEDFPRFIGHIRKEASRLLILIEDIIRLSQLDEGAAMPCEEVSLRAISDEVCDALLSSAVQKNISLTIDGDEGRIYGVHRLLYELVYNLCDNAIKYSTFGGSVRISVHEDNDRLILTVEDNGIGIPPEHREKIFERFYRVDKSHSKQSGGTGLGLSIVKHAVLYHNGKISIESEAGKGSKIAVSLPYVVKD